MKRRLVAVALALAAATYGCQGDEECNSWSGSNGSSSWSNCGDKRARKVECDFKVPEAGRPPDPTVQCHCYLGGVVGKSFEMKNGDGTLQLATHESATQTANEQCGWHVSP
jgi:hypothetical protein